MDIWQEVISNILAKNTKINVKVYLILLNSSSWSFCSEENVKKKKKKKKRKGLLFVYPCFYAEKGGETGRDSQHFHFKLNSQQLN